MVSCTDLMSASPQSAPTLDTPYQMMTAQTTAIPQALLFNSSKDSRWLTLEVCREFQRNRCTRTEEECKFAHPPPHVDQQNGRVMCCFDSIKGKCQRKEPPCKYHHPPQHLKEQLLQNGRQNLAIKYHWNQVLAQNQIAAASQIPAGTQIMPGMAGMPGMPGMAGHIAMDGNRYLSHAAAHAAASAAAANAGVLHTGLTTQPLITPSPYLYNQYAGLQAANPMSAAALGQLPLQFAVSQGGPAVNAAAAAALESQALAQIPNSSASSSAPSMNGQKTPRADRLDPQSLLGLGQTQTSALSAMPQVSQSLGAFNMATYPYGNPAALGMQQMHPGLAGATAGLAGAYQPGLSTSAAGHLSAGTAPGSLQAVAAGASSAATQDALSQQQQQQQAKKRTREEELLLPMQVPGMGVPIKRQALDAKGGIPMFNPAAYPQLAYAPQQPAYVPVSSQMPSPLFSNSSSGNPSINGEQLNGGVNSPPGAVPRIQLLSNNVDNVNYYDDNSQLLDTLPVCRDYRSGQCNRPACKYIHLLEDHVEVSDGKVIVCRDNVKGKCLRSNCKYYHLPWYVLLRPTQNQ